MSYHISNQDVIHARAMVSAHPGAYIALRDGIDDDTTIEVWSADDDLLFEARTDAIDELLADASIDVVDARGL